MRRRASTRISVRRRSEHKKQCEEASDHEKQCGETSEHEKQCEERQWVPTTHAKISSMQQATTHEQCAQKLHVCHVRKRRGLPLGWTFMTTALPNPTHCLWCATTGKSARSELRDTKGTAPTPRPARFLPISTPSATAEWLSGKLRVTPGVHYGGRAAGAIPPTIRPATVLGGRLQPGMSRANNLRIMV